MENIITTKSQKVHETNVPTPLTLDNRLGAVSIRFERIFERISSHFRMVESKLCLGILPHD